MSVWKRLTNLAKGQAKVWAKGERDGPDAIFEAELEADRRARVREADRRRPAPAPTSGRRARVRPPETERVPRTDLFGEPSEAPDPTPEPPEDASAERREPPEADPVGKAASRVLDTVSDLLEGDRGSGDAAPAAAPRAGKDVAEPLPESDPFAAFDARRRRREPGEEVVEAEIVETEEDEGG
jgi:hypothetical protein